MTTGHGGERARFDLPVPPRVEEELVERALPGLVLETPCPARPRPVDAGATVPADRLARLHAATSALSRTVTADEVLDVMIAEGSAALEACSACIALLTPDGRQLRIVRTLGSPSSDGRQLSVDDECPMAAAAREGEPLFREAGKQPDEGARASIPLQVEQQRLGVLSLTFAGPRRFDSADRSFLLALTQQCAQALERARLWEAERTARAEAEAMGLLNAFLSEASSLLASSFADERALDDLVRLIVPIHADSVSLVLRDEEGGFDRTFALHVDPEREPVLLELVRLGRPSAVFAGVEEALRAGRTLLFAEVSEADLPAAVSAGPDRERALQLLRKLAIRSAIIVPIWARGRLLGVMATTFSDSGRRYGLREQVMLEELGRRVALAVDNTRLYRQAQLERVRAEEGERRAAFLAEVSDTAVAAQHPEELLLRICEIAAGRFGDLAAGFLLARDESLRLVGVRGDDGSGTERLEALLRARDGLFDRSAALRTALQVGRPFRLAAEKPASDALLDPADSESLERLGVRATLCVPLQVRGRLLGLLAFFARDEARFAPADYTLGEELARRTSALVENAFLFRRAEQSEQHYRALADTVPEIVFTAHPDGRIDYLNERFFEYSGLTLDTIQTAPGVAFHPDDLPAVQLLWREAMALSSPLQAECRLRREDGTFRWFLGSVQPLRGPDGAVQKWFGAAMDIEDRKRSEAILRTSQGELAKAVRARDDFLSAASHELKTPITSLLLQVESLQRKVKRTGTSPPVEELAPKLTAIERQSRRIVALVDRLLDVSRITAGRLRLELEPVDLSEVVAEVATRFRGELNLSGSTLELQARGELVGNWDRMRLEQIATNLVSNAIKYGQGKPVRVQVWSDGAAAHLEVLDQGIGIAPENQARIFERFERVVSARQYGGFGLGLWIVRQIVEALGGSIRLESRQGEGSRFWVSLPRAGPTDPPSPE